jgi:hypothetical protein
MQNSTKEECMKPLFKFNLGLVAAAALSLVGCGPSEVTGEPEAIGSVTNALTESEGYLEFNGTWQTCGSGCANTGADGTNADGVLTQGLTSPNMGDGGHSMKTTVDGSAGYQNKYWYVQRYSADGAPSNRITSATYEFYFYVPSAYVSTYQALEFELHRAGAIPEKREVDELHRLHRLHAVLRPYLDGTLGADDEAAARTGSGSQIAAALRHAFGAVGAAEVASAVSGHPVQPLLM